MRRLFYILSLPKENTYDHYTLRTGFTGPKLVLSLHKTQTKPCIVFV